MWGYMYGLSYCNLIGLRALICTCTHKMDSDNPYMEANPYEDACGWFVKVLCCLLLL